MAKQSSKTASQQLTAARETITDYLGYALDARMVLAPSLPAVEELNQLGLDAFSEKGLLKLASAIERAKKQALKNMPANERQELSLAMAN